MKSLLNRKSTEKYLLAWLSVVILMTACNRPVQSPQSDNPHRLPVTVRSISRGDMATYLDLSATSTFLYKSAIKAPITGYIENMLINQGDAVDQGQLLFTIKTKEASALTGDTLKGLIFSGLIEVRAASSGLISSIMHTKGDFVTSGDELCQVAVSGSLVFILDVPFELTGYVKTNSSCDIILPDSRRLKGRIRGKYPSMAGSSQTERFIIRLDEEERLPENLIVKVRMLKDLVKDAASLPKACILTDETMQNYWVMRLINDSTAVKVPVEIGISEKDRVQITHPEFDTNDLFLDSGNYGLGDTAFIKVINSTGHE